MRLSGWQLLMFVCLLYLIRTDVLKHSFWLHPDEAFAFSNYGSIWKEVRMASQIYLAVLYYIPLLAP